MTGDEILPILRRRRLGATPDPAVASEVAAAYQEVVTGMQRAYAETPAARQQAEEEGVVLRDRMQAAYPFHPALIDVMRERWTAVDSFQRTRGALRFLASCLSSLKKNGGAQPLVLPPFRREKRLCKFGHREEDGARWPHRSSKPSCVA